MERSVADPEISEEGPRNMKYRPPRLEAIFFMTDLLQARE